MRLTHVSAKRLIGGGGDMCKAGACHIVDAVVVVVMCGRNGEVEASRRETCLRVVDDEW